MNNTIKYNFDYINECYNHIIDNENKIKELKNENDSDKQIIDDIFNQSIIRNYICEKLQDAIDKFDLNKNKEDNLYNISKCTANSIDSNGEYKEHISEYKTINPNSKFDPFNDKWQFISIEVKDNKYKIKVENLKGRKHVNPYMWEPDYFETDWLES